MFYDKQARKSFEQAEKASNYTVRVRHPHREPTDVS